MQLNLKMLPTVHHVGVQRGMEMLHVCASYSAEDTFLKFSAGEQLELMWRRNYE